MKILNHPSGFLKIILREEPDGSAQRLHIWDSKWDDTDIHQHRADFTSTVVEGEMAEEIYVYEDHPDGDRAREQVNCWTDDAGEYHLDVHETSIKCRISLARTEYHRPGDTYKRDAKDLHRVVAVKVPLITLVTFGPVYQQVHTIIRGNHEGE